MKKTICALLAMVFCLTLLSCDCGWDKARVEEELQGEWIKVEENQSSVEVLMKFENGTVTRTEKSANNSTVLSGVYTLNDTDLSVEITYSDNSTQTLSSIIGNQGQLVLKDRNGLVVYNKKPLSAQ